MLMWFQTEKKTTNVQDNDMGVVKQVPTNLSFLFSDLKPWPSLSVSAIVAFNTLVATNTG